MKQICIIWSTIDVMEKATEMGINLTQSEAENILINIERKHDALIGINWDVIEAHIDLFIQEKTDNYFNSKSWNEYLAK